MIGKAILTPALVALLALLMPSTPGVSQTIIHATALATSCAVIGDSIAVGAGSVLRGCSVSAKVGVPSSNVVGRVKASHYLIVSAGSNDPGNPRLGPNLAAICARATGKVIWIVPAVSRARSAVVAAAAKCSKTAGLVSFQPGRDHVHPRAYGPLGRQIQGIMR